MSYELLFALCPSLCPAELPSPLLPSTALSTGCSLHPRSWLAIYIYIYIYFPSSSSELKRKGRKKRAARLRHRWYSRTQCWKGFKRGGDGYNWRTRIKDNLSHGKGDQKLQQKPYMLGLRGRWVFVSFCLFFWFMSMLQVLLYCSSLQ